MSGPFDGAGRGSYREARVWALVVLIVLVVVAVALIWSASASALAIWPDVSPPAVPPIPPGRGG